MESARFDRLVRLVSASPTRRAALAAALGGLLARLGPRAAAAPVHGEVCHRLGKKCDEQRGDQCCGTAKCVGGTCRCRGTKKPCRGRCIPAAACCDAADCGNGVACQGGACLCLSGFKPCNGGRVPQAGCCADADCGAGRICAGGTCVAGQGTCPNGASTCAGGGAIACNGTDVCQCEVSTEGTTRCADSFSLPGRGGRCGGCTDSAECVRLYPDVPGVFCARTAGTQCCDGRARGLCSAPCPR